jgi:predicted nucleic acid-binding Zn ribbon protein
MVTVQVQVEVLLPNVACGQLPSVPTKQCSLECGNILQWWRKGSRKEKVAGSLAFHGAGERAL